MELCQVYVSYTCSSFLPSSSVLQVMTQKEIFPFVETINILQTPLAPLYFGCEHPPPAEDEDEGGVEVDPLRCCCCC